MAGNQQSAVVYLRKTFGNLVSQMQNFPVIVENLYQRRVFNDSDVKAVKAKWREQDKARYILDRVINEGETASYELLKILDFTWKRTLRPTLHNWIKRYSFREDSDTIYSFGTKPCKDYQTQLKMKAKSVLENQMEQQSTKYLLHKQHENFHFIPLASGEEYVVKNQQYKKLGAYIPNQKETVSPADLLRWMDRNILLIGKPGIGKTTIAQQMLRLWTEKKGTEPDYLFYFNENILSHSTKLMTLESLLFDVYVKAKEEDQQEVLQDMKVNAKNVVFIFDGVTHVQEDSVLKKIMNHDVLHEAKVIITYRTEMEGTHFLSDWTTKILHVQGFSEESIRTYYQMTLGHNPDLLNVVLNNQELFSLSYVPMYAFMIANMILLKDDTVLNNPHTFTNMNIHIFFHALMKYGDKTLWEIYEYLKENKDQLYLLMINAFSATVQKSLNLPEISSDETNICHAFLKMIPIRDSLTSETKYCAFLHNTMQEFFSALWLVENPYEIEKVLNLCQTEENHHMRHVLPFLCGLLGEHNNKLLKCLFSEDQMKKTSECFIEKLLDTFLKPQSEDEDIDLLYVCQCLYELQSSNACLMFLEKMKHQLDIDVNLDPHQSCALSYVISQSRDKEVHLNLQNRTVSDTGMIMILSCSPQIRLKPWKSDFNQIKFLLQFIHKVSVKKTSMEDERMTSYCCCNSFTVYKNPTELADALLDLYSHVKDYETQTGRSLLPALQLVFQSLPVVWSIDLSKRKTSILLEVLKLQTVKKRVELRGWSYEKSEVVQFLHCLPYISQLGFRCFSLYEDSTKSSVIRYLLSLIVAAENKTVGEKRLSTLLSSVCSYKAFPFQCSPHVHGEYTYICHTDFLLDLCSHVKDYETQTGRSLLPACKQLFQSSADVWIIDVSKRKTSILLEVLKLQTEKKPLELRGCPDEESEVMSFLQCLPYISQLSFVNSNTSEQSKFLLGLFIKAAETKRLTGEQMQKLLTLVWDTSSLKYLNSKQTDFLLDLYSRAKDCVTQTGRTLIPALKLVFQSSPDVWIIDLSKRKTSILLEVLKLQTEKKPVELTGWTDEESEVMSFLQCLPYISQLRFYGGGNVTAEGFIARCFIKAAETEIHTRDQMLKLLTSVCTYRNFPYENCYHFKQSDFLLDLYSHVKDFETQTGRSLLQVFQSVFQAPDVWIIDLSKRKISILLEVLKLQTEKKQVKLRGWTDEESEVMSFLQCLPYISQLRFFNPDPSNATFTLRLFIKAVESETQTGGQMLKLLTSVCTYTSFPYENIESTERSDFLLDLYSHVKDYETQTGRSLLPALLSVYQAPDVWIIDVSGRKTPILLEVLKLQTEKKPVEMRGWLIECSTVMCLLKCLPYISKLRIFSHCSSLESIILKSLFVEAAETERRSGDQTLKLLTSVCTYTSFPYENSNCSRRGHFLLDLYSNVKDYETQSGRSLLPALQSVYTQSAPDVWIIDLSNRKASILLEVLKLQTEKKPLELRGWTDEKTEVMSFLHCLPYISQLSGAERYVLSLFKLAEFRQNPELVNSLLQALDFNLSLEGRLPSSICRFVAGILRLFADKLTLTVRPQAISLRGTRLLFRHITNIQTLRLSGYMLVRTVRALRSSRVPVSVNELSVDLNVKRRSDSEMSRVLSRLASLLRLWTVQCLNLSDCRMKSLSLILLLSQQSPVTLRLPEEILQTLAECVYEAQEEELTLCFLKKMGGDLTSCSFRFKKLQYFLQHDISHVTVNLKETDMSLNIREFLPFLNRIHFQQMSSTVMMSLMREIYETRSLGFVSGLLSSVKNCINLQNRALDSVHCAFLRFILQNRTGLTLNMLWTSIPEEELKSFLPLLSRVSCLSVDRVLLLRMLHCCSSSDVQQEASSVLLSALQHKLDFSCCSALDLTEDTPTQTLQLTAEDCHVMSTVIQRVYRDTHTLTQLNLHDCQMNTAGIDQLFTILHSVKLQCGKSMLLQFLSHVDDGKAECLSRALGEEVDLSQTHLDLQVCRGLALVLEHSEGLTELDLSQCHLTDQSLDVLLPNLHKAQNIDFSGNSITDAGALKIMLFNNRIESRKLFLTDRRFEIW